ncbi:beta-(1-6) glucans synthase [Rhodoplanes sp. TEM]|uniref:Endo-1,3-beta-glucanase btgC n=1 Tax=Rhodoplanes tepidamans TaxID=200616 RepID=A0ABT5JHQ5_RHOTP|nr:MULTISPECIES: beta-(1-6) glucans synthase [Rhodoplanes]MDC7789256.1 beta-(1-6) glucans synthase [Rhodoplanes tepidamans]MDC7985806.1 beta-(1-6) glucans synthase [Rhodoplanes sp. TEM]MDQ0358868.1 glucan 1,3-beta-glucosidase [Rhodoplanes tepidamans]
MRLPLGLMVVAVALVAGFWWWIGHPVPVASGAPADRKLECISYAPFRGAQNPFDLTLKVEPWQIEEDLKRLAAVTRCIRTYSIRNGLDQVPAIAERHGLKVLQGLWLSSHRELNRAEIAGTVALAKRFPQVITGVVVGNEVLLRGELSAVDLGAIIRDVKAAVPVPVTYADVWEFWLRNRDLASAVDFVTIHILPYWEDIPIPAEESGAHVESIVRKVAEVFPGRDILVGEVGWPSAGRMREAALPSLRNQALVVQDVLARAARAGFRANIIEAFDQPWKRILEGTVGGHWGLFTAGDRVVKFMVGEPVSDHPDWPKQAGLGIAVVLAVFAAAILVAGAGRARIATGVWVAVAVNATVAGALAGWSAEKIMVESLGWGGWVRGAAFALVALAAPIVGAGLLVRGERVPGFVLALGARPDRAGDPLLAAGAWLLVLTAGFAVQTALGLVFDPRYRDFPFTALTAAIVPFLLLAVLAPAGPGGGEADGERADGPGAAGRGAAETATAVVLVLSAAFIVLNETVANWQAVWLAAGFVALAVTLRRVRVAPGS